MADNLFLSLAERNAMERIIVLAIVGVVICWIVAAFAIRKWGPGPRKCSVWCPTKKYLAKVVVEQREGEFGCLAVVDVKNCEFFPGQPLPCGKECLAHL